MANNETVQVEVDRQQWERLAAEAGLLSEVFGLPVHPEALLRDSLRRATTRREPRPRPVAARTR